MIAPLLGEWPDPTRLPPLVADWQLEPASREFGQERTARGSRRTRFLVANERGRAPTSRHPRGSGSKITIMSRKTRGSVDEKLGVPQGTLHLLVLTIVRREPLHGYGIAQRLQVLTEGTFQINSGSLFPALYALERDGLLRSEESLSENNRRARYYELTARGRKYLEQEEERWQRVTTAIATVLRSA